MKTPTLQLHGFTFSELFDAQGLARLDQAFLAKLASTAPDLYQQLVDYREGSTSLIPKEISELLISCAIILENFLAELFAIQEALAISQAKTTLYNPIALFKKYFVLRRAKKELNRVENFPSFTELSAWLQTELDKMAFSAEDRELLVALLGVSYLNQPEQHADEIEQLVAWCARAMTCPEGQMLVSAWSSFHIPERLDYQALVATVPAPALDGQHIDRLASPPALLRLRDGFKLTDERMDAKSVQDEVNYCIYCHDHDGDFCSKGFPVKKGDPQQGFKKNPLDVTLTGCPLEEKISEMHFLKKAGHTLGALAMVMVDNPMCPATGHRICNDCMKACIYQKQEPVNIPQIETRVLTDVLDLPWGVEIYDLLTRWNPLRKQQYVMKAYNGLKVLIAGMGPAGFTLAHHLLQEGCAVVGFDGLKIEPLPASLIEQPVYRFEQLKESLDERLMAGFGGVAEYGITVRWDKNFLKLIYLSLMRRPTFQVFGGIRFGGTITIDDAWEMGFDHFVIAVGAGLPKALPIPGSLAPGMRQANDFLMALQLGNAAKFSSLTNLQVRLPAVVIGGGLTGVDAATEVQAYYLALVEKVLHRYEILIQEYGEDQLLSQLAPAEKEILAEYIRHGLAVRKEREHAKKTSKAPNLMQLAHEWGGVTIAYRRSMQESPAYINNHEELKKALEEGIYYAEKLEPAAVLLNEHGHCETLVCHKRIRQEIKDYTSDEWITSTETVNLPARSILVATGTQPNTAYEFEYHGTLNRINLQYQHYEDVDGELTIAHGIKHCKEPQFGPFTSYHAHDHRVSLIGDTHPVFHGSVVKAIASGMRTYPKIMQILEPVLPQKEKTASLAEYEKFKKHMHSLFTASVVELIRKTPNMLELTVKAPQAAKHFKPGQFYRLQNFETYAARIDQTVLQMEPLAIVAAEHDATQGMITFPIIENSAAAKLCATLKAGDAISLMGPTGVRAKIPSEHETILIVGNSASFAFLRSYGHALLSAHNRVIYLCLLSANESAYCQTQLENASDVVIWLVNNADNANAALPQPTRAQDQVQYGNDVMQALVHYAKNNPSIPLCDVDRIFIIGNTDLLRAFQAARKTVLKAYLVKDPKVFGAVYGNMQCMLKGVCAQCLQWQIDPETGKRTKAVFACSWQDQPLEIIDIDHIDERQLQNRLLDQLSIRWVDYLLKKDF